MVVFEVFVELKKKIVRVAVGGCQGGSGWGCQGGCERRIEVLWKLKKKFGRGVGSGGVSGWGLSGWM